MEENRLNHLLRIGEVFFQLAKSDKLIDAGPSNNACLLIEWFNINELACNVQALKDFYRFVYSCQMALCVNFFLLFFMSIEVDQIILKPISYSKHYSYYFCMMLAAGFR